MNLRTTRRLRLRFARLLPRLPAAGRWLAVAGAIVLLLGLLAGLAEGTGSSTRSASTSLVAAASPPSSPASSSPTPVSRFKLSSATAPLPPASGADAAGNAAPGSGGLIQVSRSYPFIWPALGPITSYMGSAHPLGIDIGLEYGVTSPIVAAAGGTVSFAGGDPDVSYGYYVVVDHGDGLSSLYAHLDEIKVSAGQTVRQGDLLGYGGNTGHSTGKHLHFEVRAAYGRLDPLEVLPEDATPEAPIALDCGSSSLVIDAGSRVSLDLTGYLNGATLTSASLGDAAGADGAPSVTLRGSIITIETPARVSQSPQDDAAYDLTAGIGDGGSASQLVCHLLVRTLVKQSHYYPPLPDGEYELAPAATPTATPTPTRTPILPATPTPPAPTRTPRTPPTATATPRAGPPTVRPGSGLKATPTPILKK